MKSIYFYYDTADWDCFCSHLQSLNLEFYTYEGEKLDYRTLSSEGWEGKWFVLLPSDIHPHMDQHGQIDALPNALPFHTIKKANTILPAVIFCNEGDFAKSAFRKIKKYISSTYFKTDSGREYISESCYKDWLDYKINLANWPKIMQVFSKSSNFSFEKFVEHFRQNGYLICDRYFCDFGSSMSLKKDSYVITTADITDKDKLIGFVDGIDIRRHKRKGAIVYTFTLDYRHSYHQHEEMLLLFNKIKTYCDML